MVDNITIKIISCTTFCNNVENMLVHISFLPKAPFDVTEESDK